MKIPGNVRIPELLKKYRYPALILALGVLLLIWPAGKRTETAQEVPEPTEEAFDLDRFTEQTRALLSRVEGAGEVRLLLTLADGGRREYLLDHRESQDASGSQLQRQAVLVSGGGTQQPVEVARTQPAFRGAVILTPGADSPAVALRLKEAVSSLTGLGMDKITVIKSA